MALKKMCRFNTTANNHDDNFSGRNMHVFHIFITEKHSVTPNGDNSVFLKNNKWWCLIIKQLHVLSYVYIVVTASKKYIVQPPSIVTEFVNRTLFIQTENQDDTKSQEALDSRHLQSQRLCWLLPKVLVAVTCRDKKR
jgi:hypothetical protein